MEIVVAENKRIAKAVARSDMLEARGLPAVAITNRTIYSVGGSGRGGSLEKCEQHDIRKNEWSSMPDLNIGRHLTSICVFRNRDLYCFGGLTVSSS